jgi:ABC-type nitrate/sulfonate/bicarbonate transport system substrate-binding protein
MRIGCVDLVSNSYLPVLAAEELGFYKAEGLDAHVELTRPRGYEALRDGTVDVTAGNAHDPPLGCFPRWEGVKLVVAASRGHGCT